MVPLPHSIHPSLSWHNVEQHCLCLQLATDLVCLMLFVINHRNWKFFLFFPLWLGWVLSSQFSLVFLNYRDYVSWVKAGEFQLRLLAPFWPWVTIGVWDTPTAQINTAPSCFQSSATRLYKYYPPSISCCRSIGLSYFFFLRLRSNLTSLL